MKTPFGLLFGTVLLCSTSHVWGGSSAVGQAPAPTAYAIAVQDGNSRVWQRMDYQSSPSGGIITNTHSYTELASGLNHLVNGQWVESKEWIDILPNGTAVATNGQHQAYFPGNIYQGQIELVTPDGLQLYSRPLALSYFDGTNTVVIAELTNSIGIVVGSNQVVYPSTFTGLAADLRYFYTKSGFEQDIVIKQQPPTPESLGLNPDTARLQIMTEFFSPPQPTIEQTELPPQAGVSLTDESLGFGAVQMIQGRAFLLGQSAQDAGALVSKHWVQVDGRQILIEEVPVNAILEGLAALPLMAMNSNSGKNSHTASKHLKLPAQRLAKATSKTMLLAKADLPAKGLVLDYQTVSGFVTNITFQSDSTYYLSGDVTLKGTNNLIEGGTVIKYPSGSGRIIINGPGTVQLFSLTAPYRPEVFTAKDDDSAGEIISGSTGSPSGYYGNVGGYIWYSGGGSLSNFRIAYANIGIKNSSGNDLPTIYDGQFVNCQYAVNDSGNNMLFRNVLCANVQTNYVNSGPNSHLALDIQNATFVNVVKIADVQGGVPSSTLSATNCIFVNVTSVTNSTATLKVQARYNGFYNSPAFGVSTFTSAAYPFKVVGAGNYYLTNGCGFQGVGASSLDPFLSAELKQKTTYSPTVYSNSIISTNLTLVQMVLRDTNNAPDLGYHYDPLDYAFGGAYVSNAIVAVNPGVVIGVFGTNGGTYGLGVGANAQFLCQGQPNNLNRIVEFNTVQEQAGSGWRTAIGGSVRDSLNASPETAINIRFTDWSVLAQDAPHFYGSNSVAISVRDCQLHGGKFQSFYPTINLTNCLLERVNTDIEPKDGNVPSIRNNLIWNGTFGFRPGSVTNALVKDNLFDQASIPDWIGGVGNTYNGGYNAFVTNCDRLHPTYVSDVILSNSPAYQAGLLGNYYQSANSPLINAGSTMADHVGLYHYTTQTSQVKETNSIVDIGYHYMAVDGNGNPIDSDGDGTPDYVEDVNGNGYGDTGETNWGIILLTQPASQTIIQTSNVTFSVNMGGLTPFRYQWYFNSTAIANATNASLMILDVLTNDAGPYHVVSTNYTGSITSSNATLTVLVVPTIAITSPDNNRVFIASQTNIMLAAAAADMAGTLTQVQFFQGITNLGVVTTPPYNLTWSNVTTGAYALTARATDDRGLIATSAVVNIVVEPLFTTDNLALWLKADSNTGLTNNAPVTAWPDSSGWNGAVRSSHGQEPTFVTNILNGYPIVRFNAGNRQSFSLPNGLLFGATGAEAVVVLKAKVAKPSVSRALWHFGASGSHMFPSALAYPDTTGNIIDDFGSTNVYIVGNPAQPLDQFHVYDVAGKANYMSAWINLELQANATNNPYGISPTGADLGESDGGGGYFDGDIAEMMVLSRVLTAGERDAVNTYVNLKYGLLTTPAAPANLTATTISPTQIGLTWSFGLTNTSTVFKIERKTLLGGYYAPCATARDVTSFVDTNLLVRMTYYYRIKASNGAGDSGYSNEAQTTTQTNGSDIPFGNLALWLKADAGMVLQSTNGTVKTWFDQSGSYSDGNQATATNRPVWLGGPLGGRPVVRFNATNDQYLTLPNQMLTNATGAEALIVLKAAMAVPGAQRQLWHMGSSGSASVAYPDISGNIVEDFAGSSAWTLAPTKSLDSYHIYDVAGQNGYFAAWINSQALITDVGTFGISTNYTLGGGTNAYFDGDIAEVLIFNRVLTVAERNSANGYLVNKYQYLTPTNVLVTAQSPTQLSLSWADVASFESQNYNIDRKTGAGGTYSQVATVQNAYLFLDTNTVADTNYYYRIRVTNSSVQYISAEVSPPIVDVTNPAPGSVFGSQNISLGASAVDSDGTITQVQFLVAHGALGASAIVAGITNSPYNLIWTNSSQPGGYLLMAKAFDNGGNSRISNPVTITTALDSNGDGIPDYLQISQGNDPLNPWLQPAADTNDHTAPVITLLIPTNTIIVP